MNGCTNSISILREIRCGYRIGALKIGPVFVGDLGTIERPMNRTRMDDRANPSSIGIPGAFCFKLHFSR